MICGEIDTVEVHRDDHRAISNLEDKPLMAKTESIASSLIQ